MNVALVLQGIPEGKAWFGKLAQANQTVLHPLGILAIAILGAAMIVLPRNRAIMPMLLMACFMSQAQRITVATLDFTLLRIMVLIGWARILGRGEHRAFRMQPLDRVVIAWAVVSAVAFTIMKGTSDAAINRLGGTYDILGLYFLFRCFIRDRSDLDKLTLMLVQVAIPVFILFLIEKSTRRNMFSILGGVPEVTAVRDGRLRCQGPFPHAILAGTFWAAIIPLVASRWFRDRQGKIQAIAGCVSCTGIVILCSSSTPLIGLVAALVGVMAFPLRSVMRNVRWAILGTLVGLHIVMEAPVWHLISRINIVGGSTGFHRFRLIDRTIYNFNEWWLVGTPSTAHWGHQMFDLTNQYVREAVKGGLLSLLLFVGIFIYAFSGVGRLRRQSERRRYPRAMSWAMGVAIFTHLALFLSISISHSQQNLVVWFLCLAAVGSLTQSQKMARPAASARRHQMSCVGA